MALLAPAAAQAAPSSVAVTYGVLTYKASPGAANHLVVTSNGATVQLTDTGAGVSITPGSGCSGAGSTVTCNGVWTLSIDVGDRDNFADTSGSALPTSLRAGGGADTLRTGAGMDIVNGGGGTDTLAGGSGADRFDGGPGADVIAARDGHVDSIHCGGEPDSGTADENDTIAADCESLDTSEPPPGPTEPSGDPDPGTTDPDEPNGGGDGATTNPAGNPLANLARPVLPAQTAGVSPKGVARVRIACPAGAGRCKGRLALFLVKGHARAKRSSGEVVAARRAVRRRIGRRKFSVAAGHTAAVPVKLNRRGRRRVLRGRHRRKLQVSLVVTTRTATGKTVKTRRTITLRRRAVRRGRR